MQIAKRCHPTHRATEVESTVWILIVIFFGLAASAIVGLFAKLGG
jgi:hypothetical protein